MNTLQNLGRLLQDDLDSTGNIKAELTSRRGEPTLEFEKAGIYASIEVALQGRKVWMDDKIPEYVSQLEEVSLANDPPFTPPGNPILILNSQISYHTDIDNTDNYVGILSGLKIREANMVKGNLFLKLEYISGYSLGKESKKILGHLKKIQQEAND